MTCSADRYTEPLLRYHEARVTGSPDVDRLRAEALEANLGIARAFARYARGADRADRDDIYAAAQLGLLEALDRWTPDGGAGLLTWAQGHMKARVREVHEAREAVRVPTKTLRAAREIAESGEDIERACVRMGKRPAHIKAALSVRSCELTPEIGATSIEERVVESEMGAVLATAASCWRGSDVLPRLLRAAESLAQRREELLKGDVRDEDRSLADRLWPESESGRIRVLSSLDYALTIAHREREKPKLQETTTVDVECWRRHYVEGQMWTEIGGEWLGGVSRTRAQYRAKRAEPYIARALASAAALPDEALALWARPSDEAAELERIGVVSGESDPLTILYAVEDLEVALTEIDERQARVWSARTRGQNWGQIAIAEGISRKAAAALAERADESLRELLQAAVVVQLDLFAADQRGWISESFWSPSTGDAVATITVSVSAIRLRSMASGRHPSLERRAADRRLSAGHESVVLEHTTPMGLPACTGPPGGARASPMLC